MSFLPDGYKAEKVQDNGNDFEALKGKYVATITEVKRDQEPWNDGQAKDQIKLTFKIKQTIDGDKGENRLVFKNVNMIDTDYNGKVTTGAQHRAKLINQLCSADFDVDCSSEEAFYSDLPRAVGTDCNLSCFKTGSGKQAAMIVEKFAEKKSSVVKEAAKEEVPF